MRSTLVDTANVLADRWAGWLAASLVEACAVLVIVALVWVLVRGRCPAQVGHVLFLLVPLKLMLPLPVSVPVSLGWLNPSALVASWLSSEREAPPASTPRAEARFDPEPRITAPEPVALEVRATGAPLPGRARVRAAISPVAPREAGASPQVSWRVLLMAGWFAGAMLLAGRLVVARHRFRAALSLAVPFEPASIGLDLAALCRCAGVSESTRFKEIPGLASPGVWGVFRPTVVLPRGMAGSLDAAQLRWVLLHELAHVRRHDLAILAVQRMVSVIHFVNPALWAANRLIHQLREYACDDLACHWSEASPIESGEAFLRVLRHAEGQPPALDGALGVFGLDARASCFRRVRRLLDVDRTIRTRMGAGSVIVLLAIALLALPRLQADDLRKQTPAPTPHTPSSPTFDLRVVGPDGKPVPEARVEVRTNPTLTADQVVQGRYDHKGRYGVFVNADAEGRLVVKLPRPPKRFNVSIMTAGYGPWWAEWSSETHDDPLPARFTAELDAAWTVGGTVVDAEGRPVEGAEVHPSLPYKAPRSPRMALYIGNVLTTDASGRWSFDHVPDSLAEIYVTINHPDYKADRRSLTRAEFGIERGRTTTAAIGLDRGLTVAGKVTDESGKPIAGALVRTKRLNEIRETKTGDDGTFRLHGCEPVSARIVVSARGRATDMKELTLDPKMGPVDFVLKPGGTVRVRVLDEQGKPVPKARIFFQSWRGAFKYFEFDHVNQTADEEGRWVWHEAPLDTFEADICRPGGMQLTDQPLVARDEEYVFRVPPSLVISGKVVDAKTGEPIKRFDVLPGIRSAVDHMNWVQSERYTAHDGQYQITQNREYLAHLVRVEAPGYQPLVSREIKSDEGNVTIDFALEKGQDIVAKVMTSRIKPARGARVALGRAGSQISIQNGSIDDGSTYADRAETDAAGLFRFPPQEKDFQLIITHPEGYAHVKATPDWPLVRIIRLTPWTRVEGTLKVGSAPAARVPVTINTSGPHAYGPGSPSIFNHHDATTGADGRFVFERVVPGKAWIGRRLMLTGSDGALDVASSSMVAVDLPAGETVRLELGGTGRAVVGKLAPPPGARDAVRWSFALVTARPEPPVQEGVERPSFTATVDRDGSFRIDDMPPADYVLRVRFDRNGPGMIQSKRFSVPPARGDGTSEPMDLGTLTLEP